MDVHLVDGTYELFRHFHALPPARDELGNEVAAVRGVLGSLLGMLQAGKTYIAVATDHVIESFRNDLWPGYKTGEGIQPELLSQFSMLEEALRALGVVVWAMQEYEADDALASGAFAASEDRRVDRVIICTPDKDLAQCVRGDRIVQLDRRRQLLRNEAAVRGRFGVSPASIPDYLALVGDSADGFPGLRGWGAKSAAAVLSRYLHLEAIPASYQDWHVPAPNASTLAAVLREQRELAFLFRDLATLRTGIPLFESVEELRWNGPTRTFAALAGRLDAAGTERRRSRGSRRQRVSKELSS